MDKKLRKLLRTAAEENNFEKIYNLIMKESISINDLKKEEFFIDRRGTRKYSSIITNLKEIFSLNKEFKQLFNEIDILNTLFEESLILQKKIDTIPSKYVFSLLMYYLDLNIKYLKSNKNRKECKNNNVDYYINFDNCASIINDTIKSLCYNEKVYKNNQFIYPYKVNFVTSYRKKYHEIINNYINDSANTGYLEEYFNYWKNGLITITKKEDNIYVEIINRDKLLKSSYIQLKQILYNHIYEIPASFKYFNKKVSQSKLAYEGSIKLLEQYFSAKIEDIKVDGIPIKEWVTAYYAVVEVSNFNYDSVSMQNFLGFLYDRIRCKSKKRWCKILTSYGVSELYVEEIFNKMVYSKNATDLYDFPFVKVKDKFLIFRAIMKDCSPARAIISRFGRHDVNIDFKGRNFENKFYDFCKNRNIKFVNLHNMNNQKEYECDAVLYIDNTLIFCELKSKNQYRNYEYDYADIDEDVGQLNRIYEFYKNNLEIVKKAFIDKYNLKLSKNLHLKKLIIYSRAVDGCIKKEGVLCIDYLKFITPFLPIVIDEYSKNESLQNLFNQEFSIRNLFKFYECPFYIFDYRNRAELKDIQFCVGKYKIQGDMVRTKEFINSDIHCELYLYIRQLNEIEKLGGFKLSN